MVENSESVQALQLQTSRELAKVCAKQLFDYPCLRYIDEFLELICFLQLFIYLLEDFCLELMLILLLDLVRLGKLWLLLARWRDLITM